MKSRKVRKVLCTASQRSGCAMSNARSYFGTANVGRRNGSILDGLEGRHGREIHQEVDFYIRGLNENGSRSPWALSALSNTDKVSGLLPKASPSLYPYPQRVRISWKSTAGFHIHDLRRRVELVPNPNPNPNTCPPRFLRLVIGFSRGPTSRSSIIRCRTRSPSAIAC